VSKKYSRQAAVGDAGMQLIHHSVGTMGFIWRPHPEADHGIDGEIEAVDTLSRVALNQRILVQSKASNLPFPGETDKAFHFDFPPADVEYWDNGNLPVVIVCSHPVTNEAWWAPSTRAERSSKRRTVRVSFDKVRDRFDASAAGLLLDLAANTSAPAAAMPIARRERLVSNLIRVEHLPSTIWAAPTWITNPGQVHAHLGTANRHFNSWALDSRTLYTFQDPSETALAQIIDGSIEQFDVDEWAGSKDSDVQRRFVRLLNGTVGDMTSADLRRHKRGYLYFRPTDDLKPLTVRVGASRRTVFDRYVHPDDESKVRNYRHYGLYVSFINFASRWFAELEPTYHYTGDGYRDLPWGSDLLKGIKRMEKNSAVRQLVEFWASYLRPTNGIFDERPLIGFGELVSFEVERGIDDKAWKADRDSKSPTLRSVKKTNRVLIAADDSQGRLL